LCISLNLVYILYHKISEKSKFPPLIGEGKYQPVIDLKSSKNLISGMNTHLKSSSISAGIPIKPRAAHKMPTDKPTTPKPVK
jgi:hypothetical protein